MFVKSQINEMNKFYINIDSYLINITFFQYVYIIHSFKTKIKYPNTLISFISLR